MRDIQRPLVFKLAAPLAAVAIVLLVVEEYCPANGFWVNLSTELIGIAVTVFVVEYILRRHDEVRWAQTTQRVRVATVQFIDFAGQTILHALKIDPGAPVFPPDPNSPTVFEQLALVVQNAVDGAVATLPPSAWPHTIAQLSAVAARASTILQTYGNRLSHEEVEHLAVIETHLSAAISEYEMAASHFASSSGADPRDTQMTKYKVSHHLRLAISRLWPLRRTILQPAA